jgi:hypothetical protein
MIVFSDVNLYLQSSKYQCDGELFLESSDPALFRELEPVCFVEDLLRQM